MSNIVLIRVRGRETLCLEQVDLQTIYFFYYSRSDLFVLHRLYDLRKHSMYMRSLTLSLEDSNSPTGITKAKIHRPQVSMQPYRGHLIFYLLI